MTAVSQTISVKKMAHFDAIHNDRLGTDYKAACCFEDDFNFLGVPCASLIRLSLQFLRTKKIFPQQQYETQYDKKYLLLLLLH